MDIQPQSAQQIVDDCNYTSLSVDDFYDTQSEDFLTFNSPFQDTGF